MRNTALLLLGAVALLQLASLAYAQGDEGLQITSNATLSHSQSSAESYFRYPKHDSVIMAHIALMIIAWVVVLPIAIMLSVAKSHLCLIAQGMFLIVNGLGTMFGIVYNNRTPNLYQNGKHGRIGWVSAFVTLAWAAISLTTASAGTFGTSNWHRESRRHTMPSMAMYHHLDVSPSTSDTHHLLSGVDHPLDGSSSQSSIDMEHQHSASGHASEDLETDNDDKPVEQQLSHQSMLRRILHRTRGRFPSYKCTVQAFRVIQTILDRMLLPLGFICFATGLIVYGGIFRGVRVFNGLAHFIKGGAFFWYGFLTFGRWMGCFADFGWAWNKKPPKEIVGRWPAMMPSAEFVESATICFYGVTNVWLEHLSNPGGAWAPNDLEHVSIALLFMGGGLLGMLVESTTIRNLLMTTIQLQTKTRNDPTWSKAEPSEQPPQWRLSLNPMPALVLFLLGSMMGMHSQASSVSNMVHALWGKLLVGFALSRVATYAIMYLKIPRSYLPQRPPTEIIASFCLIVGGLMVMMSSSDVVDTLEQNELDAMFVLNITVAFTTTLMAWAALCLALKGWAQRQEAARM